MKKRVRQVAQESLKHLQERERMFRRPRKPLREQIVLSAKGTRFWSVWLEVFAEDPDMLARLQAAKDS